MKKMQEIHDVYYFNYVATIGGKHFRVAEFREQGITLEIGESLTSINYADIESIELN